jgi:beta-N-acetylhexosaminidase
MDMAIKRPLSKRCGPYWASAIITLLAGFSFIAAASAAPIEKSGTVKIPNLPQATKNLSREEILKSDPERLARVGRHIIIGYHIFADVKALVEKKAIAGIFITDHNARRRSAQAINAEIDALQAIRRAQKLPPLVVAADQEGGAVSRLSPPLKRQPSLARILANLMTDDARRKAVESYAQTQARELQRIGVTINFGPVVDLKLNPKNRKDGETRLRLRAISADPALVSKVAQWYCETLSRHGIMCTLKHFPGLGRVIRDTHVTTGHIDNAESELESTDWVPFRDLMHKPYIATMLGHVRVSALDAKSPASFSATVITKLIRDRWQHKGLLITDDFSMGAVTRSSDGVGGAAVKALRAGVDLLLVSFNEKHYNTVMSALLKADADGLFDETARKESVARIDKALTAGTTN